MYTRDFILKEIKSQAKDNGGTPLSAKRFEEKTGIKPYDWQRYWPRFGDAQRDAGLSPNKFLKTSLAEEHLMEKFITVMREHGRWPTKGEIVVKHNQDNTFPDDHLFYNRFGTKLAIAEKILEYAKKLMYTDVIIICERVLNEKDNLETQLNRETSLGWVYLARSGPDYKIGRTNDILRRNQEIGVILPNGYELIHKIKTTDPEGVEKYWHNRFASKRKRSEWFSLKKSDVLEFRRWRRIA